MSILEQIENKISEHTMSTPVDFEFIIIGPDEFLKMCLELSGRDSAFATSLLNSGLLNYQGHEIILSSVPGISLGFKKKMHSVVVDLSSNLFREKLRNIRGKNGRPNTNAS